MQLLQNTPEWVSSWTELPLNQRFIFGTGTYSQLATSLLEFCSFVEDTPRRPEILGKPIRSLESIQQGLPILVGSSLSPFSASAKLMDYHLVPIHLLYYLNTQHSKKLYFAEFQKHYKENSSTYSYIESKLSDEESKKLLRAIIDFRLSADINHLWKSKSKGEQYFEEFVIFGENEIFFDVSAFDGANSQRFNELTNGKAQIVMFEPNPIQYPFVAPLCSIFTNFNLVTCALSNTNSDAFFDASLGSSSRLALKENATTIHIKTQKLDSLKFEYSPTFMKLDVEGAELQILTGAQNTIRRFRPKLAVSVYHRPTDLLDIFRFCESNIKNARFFLRQYTEGTDEIVLYCLPT